MNSSLERVYDDLVRLLRDDVIPGLASEVVRAQVFGAIFMLKNLQLRTDWSSEPLLGQVRAQDELFARLREVGVVDGAAWPSSARVAPEVPSGSGLLTLRDEGNARLADLLRDGSGRIDAEAMALIVAYMRLELDMEMRHTPKPMFAEMSSGKSAAD